LSNPLSQALPLELFNDLEAVTAARHSLINTLKNRLLAAGASGALMSGSGSAVFGLFAAQAAEQAAQCCQELQQEYGQTFLVEPLH
jgi:4-diphosphocytidyl-2-C-methyl-D-erythritol kinase